MAKALCSHCERRPVHARQVCKVCYHNLRRAGKALPPTRSEREGPSVYAIDALLELVENDAERRYTRSRPAGVSCEVQLMRRVAMAFKVTPTTARKWVTRWSRKGLTEHEADHVACRVFYSHPSLIWPHWFDGVDDVAA